MIIGLSSKSRFVLYNFWGAVIASTIIVVAFFLYFGGGNLDDLNTALRWVFLFDFVYIAALVPVFCIIFAVIWSNMTFNKFIDGKKELPNGMCVTIGFINGFLSLVCAMGVYAFLYATSYINISDISIENLLLSLAAFFIYWIFYVFYGIVFFGVFIFSISIGTVFLWRYKYHYNTSS